MDNANKSRTRRYEVGNFSTASIARAKRIQSARGGVIVVAWVDGFGRTHREVAR